MVRSASLVIVASLLCVTVIACGDDEQSKPIIATTTDASDDATVTTPTNDGGNPTPTTDASTDAPADVKADTAPTLNFSGEATYYDAHGPNACGLSMSGSNYLVAAMNQSQYKKSLCGTCAFVKGPKGNVTVKVVDLCPGCDYGDLDLSEEAFELISPLSAGRVKISWAFVPCP